MRISYVEIKNFHNFQHLKVELGQNVVLIGENRSGKSNFIEALRLPLDPSLPDQDRYLTAQDFWDGIEPFQGSEIRVTIRITDFVGDDNPEVLPLTWLSDCLSAEVSQPTAQLTYVYFNEGNRENPEASTADDYEFRIYPGDDSSRNFAQVSGMRQNIPLQINRALSLC